MRIRIVAAQVAGADAQEVEPTLEDAYLDIMGLAESEAAAA